MKVDQLVPEIYYSGSRDFGFLGRLYEVGLNYMKAAQDSSKVSLRYEDVDSSLIELLCNTLGFTIKHKYITKDLIYLASIFSELLKKKGTLYSIETAVKMLLASQNISDEYKIDFDSEKSEVHIMLPPNTKDLILLEDLFDYILPAGVIITFTYAAVTQNQEINTYVNDTVTYVTNVPDENLGKIYENKNDVNEYPPADSIITTPDNNDFTKSLNYFGVIATPNEEIGS